MMSEAIDETLDKDEAEEETEDLTNQVLDEIGVGVASQVSFLSAKGGIFLSSLFSGLESKTKKCVSLFHLFETVIFSSKRSDRYKNRSSSSSCNYYQQQQVMTMLIT